MLVCLLIRPYVSLLRNYIKFGKNVSYWFTLQLSQNWSDRYIVFLLYKLSANFSYLSRCCKSTATDFFYCYACHLNSSKTGLRNYIAEMRIIGRNFCFCLKTKIAKLISTNQSMTLYWITFILFLTMQWSSSFKYYFTHELKQPVVRFRLAHHVKHNLVWICELMLHSNCFIWLLSNSRIERNKVNCELMFLYL